MAAAACQDAEEEENKRKGGEAVREPAKTARVPAKTILKCPQPEYNKAAYECILGKNKKYHCSFCKKDYEEGGRVTGCAPCGWEFCLACAVNVAYVPAGTASSGSCV